MNPGWSGWGTVVAPTLSVLLAWMHISYRLGSVETKLDERQRAWEKDVKALEEEVRKLWQVIAELRQGRTG